MPKGDGIGKSSCKRHARTSFKSSAPKRAPINLSRIFCETTTIRQPAASRPCILRRVAWCEFASTASRRGLTDAAVIMKFAGAEKADVAAYRAVELIYHSYLTGLILLLSSRAAPAHAAEVVFRTFRR